MTMRLPLLAIGLSALVAACGTEPSLEAHTAPSSAPLTPEQWRTLASRTVLFGHQSVGRNILDGVRELAAESGTSTFRLVSDTDPAELSAPAFVEFAVGENGDPESKAADFARAVERTPAGEGTIAMYKHCYLDVGPETDPAAMFDGYSRGVSALQARHPGLTLVHVTVPLTTVESAPERLIRSLLGRTTRLELNAKRNEFNRLLRQRYGGQQPVFDLARIESTRRDGSRSFLLENGDTVYTLAPEWSEDGGHLNRAGGRAATAGLLALLARL